MQDFLKLVSYDSNVIWLENMIWIICILWNFWDSVCDGEHGRFLWLSHMFLKRMHSLFVEPFFITLILFVCLDYELLLGFCQNLRLQLLIYLFLTIVLSIVACVMRLYVKYVYFMVSIYYKSSLFMNSVFVYIPPC